MNTEQQERFIQLLKELRGDTSIRAFCANTPIHWAAWRAWEASDACPNLANLQLVADIAGWTMDELLAYLRTGSHKETPFDEEAIVAYLRGLSLERRAELVGRVLMS